MKQTLFILLAVMFGAGLKAQTLLKPSSISAGYFSHLGSHPGIGLSSNYAIKEFSRTRKRKPITISYRVPLETKLGFYYHKNYHNAGLLLLSSGIERTNEKNRSWAILPGLGYMQTFIPNTYVLNNGVYEKTTISHGHVTAQLCLRHARPFGKAENLTWFVQPTYLRAYKANGTYTAHVLLEIGITKHLL